MTLPEIRDWVVIVAGVVFLARVAVGAWASYLGREDGQQVAAQAEMQQHLKKMLGE